MVHVGKHYEEDQKPANGVLFEDKGLIAWALKHKIVELRNPMEDGLTDIMVGNEKFGTLPSKATHNTFVENCCKYQFAKELPRSRDPDLYSEDHTEDQEGSSIDGEAPPPYEMLDGAYSPNDHDNSRLFNGGH